MKEIPVYQYSNITRQEIKKLFNIKRKISKTIFKDWFNYPYQFDKNTITFLSQLIIENEDLIESYNEDELKMYFISPLINKIHFNNIKKEIRGFYNKNLTYQTTEFILNGRCDFYVSKGLFIPETPYFFIQEFKKEKQTSDPEPQLIAELISAIELNKRSLIYGAYIIGVNWYFVILEKVTQDQYQYFVSPSFHTMKINELKAVYKNLLFVKNEIFTMA